MKRVLPAIAVLLALACSSAAPALTPAPAQSPPEMASPEQASPSPAAPAAQPAQATDGAWLQNFVIGSLEEPGSISALTALPHHFPEHVPITLLFDGLTRFMPDGSIEPKLASEWEMGSGGLEYTFTLNSSARFHDGEPVTAEDVKFTFETALDPDSGSSTEGLSDIESIEVLDEHTVRINLARLSPKFLAEGGARGIVPQHLLEGKDMKNDPFNREPVGTGPYRALSFSPGESIVMEAVPDHYRGAPNIERIVFKILPNQNVVLTQLRTDEINYALVTPRDISVVEEIEGVKLIEAETPRFYDISPNYERAYWQDLNVREAVVTAINRQEIVDSVLFGHGQVVESNVSPVSWAFNPNTTPHPYDPEKAKALLEESGWMPGSDGIRAKDGQELRFTVLINNYDRTLEQALLVAQQDLQEVGIQMDVERLEPGVFNSRRSAGDFDAVARVWNPVYGPDQSGLVMTGNFYGYSNPDVDELSAQVLSTTDMEERKQLYFEIQDILSKDMNRIFLYTENELHAVPSDLSGAEPHPVGLFWNIEEWGR